jgi:hypothetical protein
VLADDATGGHSDVLVGRVFDVERVRGQLAPCASYPTLGFVDLACFDCTDGGVEFG